MNRVVPLLALVVCCASFDPQIQSVQAFRALRDRGDDAAAASYLTPDSRIWFTAKKGEGSPFGHGHEAWHHWDLYFHGRTTFTHWSAHDGVVSAIGHETNDYYRLLDWKPPPFRMTWWLTSDHKIHEILFEPLGKSTSRLDQFRAWAAVVHPGELADLMPTGEIDPTGDRAERWRALLIEWRLAARLPAVR